MNKLKIGVQIKGNRVLLKVPEEPWTDLADVPRPMANQTIFIPQYLYERKERKASEWEIVALGKEGRSGKVPQELKPGQRVLVNHQMGCQELRHNGQKMRIMGCPDILCILEKPGAPQLAV